MPWGLRVMSRRCLKYNQIQHFHQVYMADSHHQCPAYRPSLVPHHQWWLTRKALLVAVAASEGQCLGSCPKAGVKAGCCPVSLKGVFYMCHVEAEHICLASTADICPLSTPDICPISKEYISAVAADIYSGSHMSEFLTVSTSQCQSS